MGGHEGLTSSSFARKASTRSATSAALQKAFGETDWLISVFGIGPASLGRPRSRIIHPNSPFNNTINVVVIFLLLYTALVVPVTVGFFWQTSACERMRTLEIDCFVDTFFIIHIIYSFFVGQFHKGIYVDSIARVSHFYLRGSFWFDFMTSIPVSYLDLWIIETQCTSDESVPGELKSLKIVRVLKPLRLLKMLRILKVVKLLNVFEMFEEYFRPPPLIFRVFRMLIFIAFLGHFCACTFWLIKTLSVEEELIVEFQYKLGIGQTPHLAQKYFLATYFINTIFTTVGFGDVTADSTEEQVFSVIVMYLGTMVFGILLSEIESAVSAMRAFQRRKGRLAQELMSFLGENEVSSAVTRKILKWVEFDANCRHKELQKEMALSQIPDELRTMLVDQLHHDSLYKVPLFGQMQHHQVERFVADLWDQMRNESFFDGWPILLHNQPAENFYYILQGHVQVRLADTENSLVTVLGPGDFFGEHALIGDIRSGAEYGVEASFLCKEFVQVRVLSKVIFEEILNEFDPEMVTEIEEVKQEHLQKVINANADVNPSAPPEDGFVSFHDNAGDFTISLIVLARWGSITSRAVKLHRVSKLDSNVYLQRLTQKILIQAPGHGNVLQHAHKTARTPGASRARRGSIGQTSIASMETDNDRDRRASRISGFSEELESQLGMAGPRGQSSPTYLPDEKWDPYDLPYFSSKPPEKLGSMRSGRVPSAGSTDNTYNFGSTGKPESKIPDTDTQTLVNEVQTLRSGMKDRDCKLQLQGLALDKLKTQISALNSGMLQLMKVVKSQGPHTHDDARSETSQAELQNVRNAA